MGVEWVISELERRVNALEKKIGSCRCEERLADEYGYLASLISLFSFPPDSVEIVFETHEAGEPPQTYKVSMSVSELESKFNELRSCKRICDYLIELFSEATEFG